MYTIEQCRHDIAKCKFEISNASSMLSSAPKGSLYNEDINNKTYWYHRADSHSKILIKKNNMEFAQKLAAKTIFIRKLKYNKMMLAALEAFELKYKSDIISDSEYMSHHGKMAELAAPYMFSSCSSDIQQWANEPYERNYKYPELLKFKTLKKDCVRSKIECIIADALYIKNVPYRYESRHDFITPDGYTVTLFPDFTIMHPITNRILIWEHFGLIDNPEYLNKSISKIPIFIANNFIPSDNLILTFETAQHQLDSATIYDIIDKFLQV